MSASTPSAGRHERLTHLDERGEARMVDVGAKPDTRRRAVASARITMRPETLAMIVEGRAPKGDVFATARIAGIMASKRTADLVPMCHPIALTHVSVDLAPESSTAEATEAAAAVTATTTAADADATPTAAVRITAVCETTGPTGVEMEALTAASVAGLTLYDMCKAVDRGMVLGDVMLMEKEGGASGRWTRKEES